MQTITQQDKPFYILILENTLNKKKSPTPQQHPFESTHSPQNINYIINHAIFAYKQLPKQRYTNQTAQKR